MFGEHLCLETATFKHVRTPPSANCRSLQPEDWSKGMFGVCRPSYYWKVLSVLVSCMFMQYCTATSCKNHHLSSGVALLVCCSLYCTYLTASSEYIETPDLPPNPNLVHKIAELEHKACRSLMHRYGLWQMRYPMCTSNVGLCSLSVLSVNAGRLSAAYKQQVMREDTLPCSAVK